MICKIYLTDTYFVKVDGDDLESCMERATRVYGNKWKVAVEAEEVLHE